MTQFSEQDLDFEGRPSIPEFYAGRSIFITGGSGFMGKILIEKLLRCCVDLRTIYILLRPKRGKSLEERMCVLTEDALFDRLRKEQPRALRKLHAVCGDVSDLGLGLSEEDRLLLQKEVSIIFHSAASVRFDDSLRDAVLINVRGTRELLELAKQMPRLEVLLHVSTTFCNFDQPEVKEQVYPAPGNWRTLISLAEKTGSLEKQALECLTLKILGKSPNTYTYAKALSEHVVQELKDVLPVIIVRPSIVLSTMEEPVPGWTDNFNGPMGLFLGGGKGILRTAYADPDHIENYIPVDIAIRAFIVLAWHRALSSKPKLLPVYNASKMTTDVRLMDLINIALSWLPTYPLDNAIWHPNPVLTTNKHVFFMKVIFFHLIPGLLVDGLLKITGRKPMLVKLHRRIYIANTVLAMFGLLPHCTDNSKFISISQLIKPCDLKQFDYNIVITDPVKSFKSNILGAKKYLLKDKLPLDVSRRHYRRMYLLDRLLKGGILLAVLFLIFTSNTVHLLLGKLLEVTHALL